MDNGMWKIQFVSHVSVRFDIHYQRTRAVHYVYNTIYSQPQ
jgi:hypothetical protein